MGEGAALAIPMALLATGLLLSSLLLWSFGLDLMLEPVREHRAQIREVLRALPWKNKSELRFLLGLPLLLSLLPVAVAVRARGLSRPWMTGGPLCAGVHGLALGGHFAFGLRVALREPEPWWRPRDHDPPPMWFILVAVSVFVPALVAQWLQLWRERGGGAMGVVPGA